MKHICIVILILAVIAPVYATKYAGEIFAFSPGVSNQAMGSTGLSSSESMAAGWWNPAILAKNTERGIELMRSEHFEGLLSQNQFSIIFGNKSRTSITVNHLSIDKIKLTKLEDENAPLSNDNRPYVWKTVTNQDMIIYGSIARDITQQMAVGISPKLAYRSLAQHDGYGFGADIGAFWQISKVFAGAINLRDFFGTQILWESGEHEIAMPNLDTELSCRFPILKGRIPVLIALRAQAYPEERGDASNFSSDGLSADFHAGLMIKPIPALKVMTGYDVDSITAGLGVLINDFGIDYAFKNNSPDGLGYSQRIALSYIW